MIKDDNVCVNGGSDQSNTSLKAFEKLVKMANAMSRLTRHLQEKIIFVFIVNSVIID